MSLAITQPKLQPTKPVLHFLFLVSSLLFFCLVPCGRLSWLLVSFWGHVNIVHHIVSYRIITNCIPKLVAMATSLNTSGPPSNTLFLRHIRAHNPNSSWIGSAVFAQISVECPYTLQLDPPLPLKIASSHGGSGLPI